MENISIRIWPENKARIEAKIPWADGEGPIVAKSINGYRWVRGSKTWTFPLNWDNCVALRKASQRMGCGLVVSPGLKEWARAEKARREAVPDHKSMSLVDLPRVRQSHPEIWKALSSRPFQTVGVKFAAAQGQLLLADEPGLGKTLQTIATMIERDVQGPILVVANKSAAEISWPNEIRKWAPEDKVVKFGAHIPKAKRDQVIREVFENEEGRTWVIMNPHWIRMQAELDAYGKYVYEKGVKIVRAQVPEIFMHKWAAIVADESHETLAINTGNAKKWSQQRQGLGALECDGVKISISGTPMRGKPDYMYGHLNWLFPDKYNGFWPWAKKHFQITSGYGDSMEIGKLLDPDAFYKELEPIMLRRLKSEVASDLPPKQYGGSPHPSGDVVGVWLPLEGEQKKMYDDFVTNQVITDNDGKTLDAVGILAVYTRLKQLATMTGKIGTRLVKMVEIDPDTGNPMKDQYGKKIYVRDENGDYLYEEEEYLIPQLPSNKYEWLKEWLMERDLIGRNSKGTGKVIIASQFRSVIDAIREDLKINHGTESFAITGETTAKQRVEQQDRFQNDPDSPKLFFLQSKAGGTSLTLDQADDVIILDEMWDPDVQLQIEDRAHRLSRSHNVGIWYVRSLGTIEEYIGTTVAEREETTRSIMDGARGIDISKRLMRKSRK